jgi:hypothetical protein
LPAGRSEGHSFGKPIIPTNSLNPSNTRSTVLGTLLSATADVKALPFSLPSGLVATHLTANAPDSDINRFGALAGSSLQDWEQRGWIHGGDPRGWAQWYTHFWAGRRTEDDERQVKRWLKVAGPTGRFKRTLIKKFAGPGGRDLIAPEEVGCVVRQCLWQWAYELTESEFDKAMA